VLFIKYTLVVVHRYIVTVLLIPLQIAMIICVYVYNYEVFR